MRPTHVATETLPSYAMKGSHYFIFTITLFLFFEIFSRFPLAYWGMEFHPRFHLKIRDNQIIERVNSRGAIGNEYKGQPLQIAVFGVSTTRHSFNAMESWPSQIQSMVPDSVHVDNYSIAGQSLEIIHRKLQEFKNNDLKYDWVIIQGDISLNKKKSHLEKNYYFDRWQLGQSTWAVPKVIKKWWERKKGDTPSRILSFFHNTQSKTKRSVLQEVQSIPKGVVTANLALRQNPAIQPYLRNYPVFPKLSRIEKTKGNIQYIYRQAKNVSKNLAWIPLLPGYAPNMLKEYAAQYRILEPIDEIKNKAFHSPSSFYRKKYERMKMIEVTIKQLNFPIKIINYYQNLNPLLEKMGDLYLDEMHHSKKGNRHAAKFIGQSIFPELFKNQSK